MEKQLHLQSYRRWINVVHVEIVAKLLNPRRDLIKVDGLFTPIALKHEHPRLVLHHVVGILKLNQEKDNCYHRSRNSDWQRLRTCTQRWKDRRIEISRLIRENTEIFMFLTSKNGRVDKWESLLVGWETSNDCVVEPRAPLSKSKADEGWRRIPKWHEFPQHGPWKNDSLSKSE